MQLRTKTFLTKTKKGNILKIVREHYLRDDIWCGSQVCKLCHHTVKQAILEENPKSQSSTFQGSHYLMLDTNVILHQIDVLEDDALCNVIILQTVLEETKQRSQALYKRLNDIIADKKRKFYVFVNEHHEDTYVERLPGEKINDRNDRAIRAAAKWYTYHLKTIENFDNKLIILISEDEENRRLAEADDVAACSLRTYVESLTDCIGLIDKLSIPQPKEDDSQKDALFPPHLTSAEIQNGIKSGRLKQGKYSASRENYTEGSIMVHGYDKAILLQGRSGTNRAVDGDTVAVEILPKEQWSKPSGMVVLDEEEDKASSKKEVGIAEVEVEPVEGEEGEVVGSVDTAEATPTGRVVGIIRRRWRQYCGILQPSSLKGATRHLFVPAEKKVPRVRIETRQAAQLTSQKILVALDSWPRYSRYPLGHFVRALGQIGDRDTENEVILLEHDVPHSKFSDAVLACLPQEGWTIPEDEIARRVDLRDSCICSVDPPGCTDIDDALHCRPLPDGNFEVGVHIADVTYFVKPGTAIDAEAAKRSTTVYLVGRRVDMLPDMLSSNLCSLRGGEERLAFSCVWTMDPDANILNVRFHKSVIKSRSAMTYQEAQLTIDSQRSDELADGLRGLLKLARILRHRRRTKGALILASPEIRFQIDSVTNDPMEVEAKTHFDTHWMVEEFMLLANTSVAEKTAQDFPELAMLRRHEAPPQANFDGLVRAAAQKGVQLDTTTGLSLGKSLDAAPESINLLLRILTTRCMKQALYFTAGELKPDDYHHYGLACPIYTHFTSPIRRYADVVVHRLLATSLGISAGLGGLVGLGGIRAASALASHINVRHRAAQYASRASVALATHTLFRKIPQGSKESGMVLGVRKNALQILVTRLGLEGLLMLPADKFTYNPDEQSQAFGDITFRIFDTVTVRLYLDSSQAQHQRLVFELLEPHIEGFSPDIKPDALEPAKIGTRKEVEDSSAGKMDVDNEEKAGDKRAKSESAKKSKKKKSK